MNDKPQEKETPEALREFLGIGLSRLLRYSYGGFLLIALASVVAPIHTHNVLHTIPWELAALSALVIGAGIYAVHRSVAIPLHHLVMCFFWGWIDEKRKVKVEDSVSPTRWLESLTVPKYRRILAYTALRQSDLLTHEERRDFNIAHAENGLVVMTSEGFLIAGLYALCHHKAPFVTWMLFVLFFLFFLAPYPRAFDQHRFECMMLRKKNEDGSVTGKLIALGIIDRPRATPSDV